MKWKIINLLETVKHKAWVMWYIVKACGALLRRGIQHDLSKFTNCERPYFEKALPALRALEYGSQEYMQAIESLGPALGHHYSHNSHHPEFYKCAIIGLTPLDLIEMLCDWKAAGKRHATGNMLKSLAVNKERFIMNEYLHSALERDAHEIKLV